ncbi:MAG TPA: aminotransferase class V-fold PLP-dependent enzyme [Methylomirabilota bacterium]|nr:aminotransferase class V-fold PLP-dependent enzyme [Methylomirabilota bacterium]
MRVETLAIHAGRAVDSATGAVALPIHPSTTFERDADGGYARGHLYSRNSNPNRDALERCLADLEGGAAAAAFASGNAASAAILLSLAPGDHVVAPVDLYYGTARLMREHMARWGLEVTFVDMRDPAEFAAALRPSTRLVWLETPSNPMLTVTDVAAVAAPARRAGVVVVCDNTLATPVLQRPLALGADLVKHSTTKFFGGHADVLGGAVVAARADGFFEKVRALQAATGGVPAPFDCWLLLRSIRTLPWRVRAHADNALAVARFLRAHPRVEAVHYPGLPDHPAHAVAARQMSAFGGVLSFEVRGGRDAAMAVAAKLRLITRATSYGSVESLVEHRASIEGPQSRTPQGLLRLSVGLEHPDDVIEDLAQALG